MQRRRDRRAGRSEEDGGHVGRSAAARRERGAAAGDRENVLARGKPHTRWRRGTGHERVAVELAGDPAERAAVDAERGGGHDLPLHPQLPHSAVGHPHTRAQRTRALHHDPVVQARPARRPAHAHEVDGHHLGCHRGHDRRPAAATSSRRGGSERGDLRALLGWSGRERAVQERGLCALTTAPHLVVAALPGELVGRRRARG